MILILKKVIIYHMSEIENQSNFSSNKNIKKLNKFFIQFWIILNLLGIIGLFFKAASVILNPIAWICYILMLFPTTSLYDALLDWHRKKELADRFQLIKGILYQIAIGFNFAIITIIYFPAASYNVFLDVLLLTCSFIFLISIVFIILFLGYAYFSEY